MRRADPNSPVRRLDNFLEQRAVLANAEERAMRIQPMYGASSVALGAGPSDPQTTRLEQVSREFVDTMREASAGNDIAVEAPSMQYMRVTRATNDIDPWSMLNDLEDDSEPEEGEPFDHLIELYKEFFRYNHEDLNAHRAKLRNDADYFNMFCFVSMKLK